MIENIKISVVIPIFNNIDTIERCLDSIYSQTYKNYECILADDCSDVDYSYLQEKYPSLIIIRLPQNSGAGVARQYALDNAVTGDWVVFIDSDDEFYSRIVFSNFVHIANRKKDWGMIKGKYIYNNFINGVDESTDVGNELLIALHGIFFNVKLLKENNIRFHDTLRYHEDVYFNLLCRYTFYHKYGNKSIHFTDSYYYKQNATYNSVTQTTYDGKDYFEAKYKYEAQMFLDVVDKLSSIISDEEKINLFGVFILNSFLTFEKTNYGINNFERKMDLIKETSKIFLKLKELGLSTFEDVCEVIFNSRVNNVTDTPSISCVEQSMDGEKIYMNYFRNIWSMYLYYMDGQPIKKVECVDRPLLSIVVPVYNSKNIIRDTLDDLYKKINIDLCEVIVVNDCSPDGEYEYLMDSYKNLIVVNNESNMGYACSRQTGVDIAKGKWLLFLDHDDIVTNDLMDKLNKIESSDVPYQLLHFGAIYYYKNFKNNPHDTMFVPANPDLFHGSIFNLDYIKSIGVRFSKELRSSEDVYYHRSIYFSLADRYYFLICRDFDKPIYVWNITGDNQTSIMKNNRCWMEENYNDHVRASLYALSFNKNISLNYKTRMLYRFYFEATTLCDIWSKHSNNFRTEIYNDIQLIAKELYTCGINSENIIERINDNLIDTLAGIQNAIPLQSCNIVDKSSIKCASRSEYFVGKTISKHLLELAKQHMKAYEDTLRR